MKLNLSYLVFFVLTVWGCQTVSPQTTNLLTRHSSASREVLQGFPYVLQDEGDCGPVVLWSVLEWHGYNVSLEALRTATLTPAGEGTLPANMVSASRHQGVLAVPLGSMMRLVQEIDHGLPVVALLNRGFSWWPSWHYVAVLGYDLGEQTFTLYDGDAEPVTMPMTYFERHWELADFWGMTLSPPDRLPVSARENSVMTAAAGLEAVGKLAPAGKAYQAILDKWPDSLGGLFGSANLAAKDGDLYKAMAFLERAKKAHPDSKHVDHNLEVVRFRLSESGVGKQ